MTNEQVDEIDDFLRSIGWSYDPQSEEFVGDDEQQVEWYDVLAEMPDLSLNQLEAYCDRKQLARSAT